jgi:ABC-type nitrate/sulfonate/bicarbonate transport system permease component
MSDWKFSRLSELVSVQKGRQVTLTDHFEDSMLAYIVLLGIIGIMIDQIFTTLSKRCTPWKNDNC